MFDVKLMRAIDERVGNLACSAIAVAKRLKPARTVETPRKIAVAKFFGMGSLVVASPALAALREAFPDAEVHFISFASNKSILDLLGVSDRQWYIDPSTPASFAKTTLATAAALRREGIDLLVDFEFFAKFPLVLGSLCGIPTSAGFCLTPEPWRRTLLDVAGTYNHYFHTKDIFLSLVYLLKTRDLYYLGFNEFQARYGYPRHTPREDELSSVRRVLAERGLAGRRIVLVNPNTSPELAPEVRKWPEERYADLARTILREYPDTFVGFIGAKSEAEYVGRIAAAVGSPHAVSLAGAFDIRHLLALFSLSELFISNDSGPMHLACLVDAKIIGLFFADTPTLFAPLAPGAKSISPELYSLPLFTVYNGKDVVSGLPLEAIRNVPAQSVTLERVLAEVRPVLDARSHGRAAAVAE